MILDFQRMIMKNRRERDKIENPTRGRALNELGVPSVKLNLRAGADTGMADTLYFIPGGRPLLHEYKWGTVAPEPKQVYTHMWLKKLGYDVQVHNSVESAFESIRQAVAAQTVHEEGRQVAVGTRRRRSIS